MKQAQGIVTAIAEQGKARVAIVTDDTLPGCSSKTEHCHQCSEGTASLVVKVFNRVGAGVGDSVTVLFKSGAVLKSVLILLGIPMTGILAGTILGNFLYGTYGVSQRGAFLAGAACFGFAVLSAFFTYRRVSADLQPYIDQVIPLRPAPRVTFDPVCGMEVDPEKAAGKVDYQGRPYFFCNPGCLEAFIREPSKYAVLAECPRIMQKAKTGFPPARE